MVTIEQIKDLREETGLSISEVKKALEEAKGDAQKAKEILKSLGKKIAGKKADREAKSGVIEGYIHSNGKTGVLLDIRCETDFVANSPEFKNLAHELALQIVAMKPLFVSENDIPAEFLDGETKIFKEEATSSGKPENIVNQIVEGKLKKYKDSVCLLAQTWVKDDTKTVKNLIEDTVAKVGENIEIKKFARYEI
jgi:elongation factor Ts